MSTAQTAEAASKQSEANKLHYEAAVAQARRGEPLSPQEAARWNDTRWAALSAEPDGVKYLEIHADGVPAMWIVPDTCADDRAILYCHGGGFVGGSISSHRKMVGHLAKAAGCRALLFEYAYAYQHKYPHQLETAFTVYRWLLEQGIIPAHVAIAGDSAGAILTVGTLLRARDEGLPQPAAVMFISGWFDMALTAKSFETNRTKDAFFQKETVDFLAINFLGEHADRRDPYASPLYADLRGFPPIILQAGADETLVDESRMFAELAEKAGVKVRLDVFPHMLHSFQMMAGRAPEADEAIVRLAEWVRPNLGLDQGVSDLERNKRTVVAFYSRAFNDHQPAAAVAQYVGPEYIQHNPNTPSGPGAFVESATGFIAKFPRISVEIKRVIAEGDLVVAHNLVKLSPEDRGLAGADIFRLRDGKIVEHWDVRQPIPETAANENTMF